MAWDDLVPVVNTADNVYDQFFAASPHPSLSGPVTVVEWANVEYFNIGRDSTLEVLLDRNTGMTTERRRPRASKTKQGRSGLPTSFNQAALTGDLAVLWTYPEMVLLAIKMRR